MNSGYKNQNELFLQTMQGLNVKAKNTNPARLQSTRYTNPNQTNKASKSTFQQSPCPIQLRDPPLQQQAYSNRLHSQVAELSYQLSLPAVTWRRLKRGRLMIAETIDLHGRSVDQARVLLEQQLPSYASNLSNQSMACCIRIIHGKGLHSQANRLGSLKMYVNYWLRQFPQVKAFCSCQPMHGGSGAVYVLLKQ